MVPTFVYQLQLHLSFAARAFSPQLGEVCRRCTTTNTSLGQPYVAWDLECRPCTTVDVRVERPEKVGNHLSTEDVLGVFIVDAPVKPPIIWCINWETTNFIGLHLRTLLSLWFPDATITCRQSQQTASTMALVRMSTMFGMACCAPPDRGSAPTPRTTSTCRSVHLERHFERWRLTLNIELLN